MLGLVRYVGDPFVDTGVAVLEHQLGKPCEEISDDDLFAQGAELSQMYSERRWSGILKIHFPNSGWTNPNMRKVKVAEYQEKVLRGFNRKQEVDRYCEYCRRPATAIVDGSTIPLLSSAKSMDCGPGGRTGSAVCGYCLVAEQFYPLATLKVGARALLWWSPDRQWTYLLAGIALREVRRFLSASPDGTIKPRFPWSRLLTVAREAFEEWSAQTDRIPLRDIIGCYTTNYRTNPEIDELRIPRELFEFWYQAASGFGKIYDSVVAAARESKAPKVAKRKKPKKQDASEWERRNGLYEALGEAFQTDDFRPRAVEVAKKYFIVINKTAVQPGSFGLACLFLEKLAGMRKKRIESIKEIADAIAGSSEKKKLIERLVTPRNFVDTLVYAQSRIKKAGGPPLRFEAILEALDLASEEDSLPRDFWLVRNLIILRVLEQADPETVKEIPEPALETPSTEN